MADEPNKIVITDVFGEKKPKHAMKINLASHPGIEALVVEVPEDLNARQWGIGDDIKIVVAGIVWKGGAVEGAQMLEGN